MVSCFTSNLGTGGPSGQGPRGWNRRVEGPYCVGPRRARRQSARRRRYVLSVSHPVSHARPISLVHRARRPARVGLRKESTWLCSCTRTPSRVESPSLTWRAPGCLATQDKYGVSYLRYWVHEAAGKIFCLVEAPDAETATELRGRHPRRSVHPPPRSRRGRSWWVPPPSSPCPPGRALPGPTTISRPPRRTPNRWRRCTAGPSTPTSRGTRRTARWPARKVGDSRPPRRLNEARPPVTLSHLTR